MRFGGIVAVNELSFGAERRKITALIGPNGAGKTTVFNCITGFYKPSSGSMLLTHDDGHSIHLERLNDFRISKQAKVARTFQNIRLFPGMTALENLMVAQHNALMRASGLTFLGLIGAPSWRSAEKGAITWRGAGWSGSVARPRRRCRRQSAVRRPGGWKSRLCAEPALLCLRTGRRLLARESAAPGALSIRGDRGTSILLIRRDMSVVLEISDHVVVMVMASRYPEARRKPCATTPR
jgi:branched-chain amino acid transport system ATP-binding protein